MSFGSVRAVLARVAPDVRIIDQQASTATVAEAAATLGVVPGGSPRPCRCGSTDARS